MEIICLCEKFLPRLSKKISLKVQAMREKKKLFAYTKYFCKFRADFLEKGVTDVALQEESLELP